jgi:hypothetical protein
MQQPDFHWRQTGYSQGASQVEPKEGRTKGRSPMAKSQMGSTKEKKKPKTESAKKKKAAPARAAVKKA